MLLSCAEMNNYEGEKRFANIFCTMWDSNCGKDGEKISYLKTSDVSAVIGMFHFSVTYNIQQ